eukprot:scaffold33187_cov62-Phaeocystis_antarctica.AAC.1
MVTTPALNRQGELTNARGGPPQGVGCVRCHCSTGSIACPASLRGARRCASQCEVLIGRSVVV